jgi:hypothetical protein
MRSTVHGDLESDFTMGDLARFMKSDGSEDAEVMIISHGETYGIGGLLFDPGTRRVYLEGGCPSDAVFNPAAVSVSGDPLATARNRHQIAERLAAHLEEIAACVRADYPKPAN